MPVRNFYGLDKCKPMVLNNSPFPKEEDAHGRDQDDTPALELFY